MTPQLKAINVKDVQVCTDRSVHIWLGVGKLQS